ncbi:ABC transporter permease [Weissella halotolerans]|uniref:Binding-protein-dependent transport systems inner membrane component n=1 Tax=Weissella halotolerans DSM 20190 TaxID=1123500 RepID=A0A0R2FV31_9LACO|nr:ABC transporter permease [Weissella halotolerans]KRN32255.1 binding-protein-dependent transport systems inner membrane component [Weissella halotolerans DSM 20190]
MQAFFAEYGPEIVVKTGQHIYISLVALLLGIIVALPLGILLTRMERTSKIVISFVSALQTIPSLALLALMIPIFGIGRLPAIVALFIYSLLPILRNTYLGLHAVDSRLRDVATGMGMSNWQSIRLVELPLAMPTIMSGIHLSAVYVISWTTLASYIGAGGLGDMIFSGLYNFQPKLIFAGTIPVTLLALGVDFLLTKLQAKLTPVAFKLEEGQRGKDGAA